MAIPDKEDKAQTVGLRFRPELYSLVKRAAEKRGMSMSSYVRRSAMAFVCFDLGLDWRETMAGDRGAAKIGKSYVEGGETGGDGFGPWRIEGLHD